MQNLPLTILSKEEGIPIPDNIFSFSLTHEASQQFKVSNVELRPGVTDKFFAIAISNEGSIALELCSTEEERMQNTEPIGVVALLISKKIRDFDTLVKAKVLFRTEIQDLRLHKDAYSIPYNKIEDKILPGEEELIADLALLINYIVENENIFSANLKQRVKNTKNLIKASNILVNDLPLDTEDRLEYLQYRSNLERVTFVIRNLFLLLTKLRGPKTKTRKAKVYIPLDDGMDGIDPEKAKKLILSLSQSLPKEKKETDSPIPEGAPEEVKKKIQQERNRLKELPPSSLEYQTVKEYLGWVEGIPWNKLSYKEPNLKTFIDLLNETHYGLDQVKECILDHMTIEKLSDRSRGSVICFLGPPGTGKTSIAKSIAKATNRKIIKIALGGMSDEAELRGHRRTYVASRPGRIISGIKNCETLDPLILLDEVDKIAASKGDPASALLEILDPEQNNEFIDRYVEIPVDLSNVMFICTANYEENIPPALRDRFEIVEFREYTPEERREILKSFLIPEVIEDFSLSTFDIEFTEDSLTRISLQAGVRDIKRTVQKLLRKAAVKIVVDEQPSVEITEADVNKILKTKKSKRSIGFSGD